MTCLRCVRLDLLACRDCAPHLMHPVAAATSPRASEEPPAIRAGRRWIDLDDYTSEPERTRR